MSKKFLFQLTTIGLTIIFSTAASFAASINIDARVNDTHNPVVEFLNAGEYEIIPIGKSSGGLFNAWNFLGIYGLPYWVNMYNISSSEFSLFVGDNTWYSTENAAFANTQVAHFTLKESGFVNFFISDTPLFDNTGGISLSVNRLIQSTNPVPIPSAVWLFSTGLFLLLGIARKKAP